MLYLKTTADTMLFESEYDRCLAVVVAGATDGAAVGVAQTIA